MKRISLLFCFSFLILSAAFGQSGTWTWISGDSMINAAGVYGTQGVPSINNHPPGEYEAIEWKDKQGNFWIYGGTYPNMDDLWKYNPFTNEWTWVKGDSTPNKHPVYGIKGVASPLNNPGSRCYCAATWVDLSGNFWLFGTWYSDLWKYDISTNQWTWMNGDTVPIAAVHGVQGIPSALNLPGSRGETCSAWTDSLNNLWLFGGSGRDDSANGGFLNDLCKYDIATNEWTWMKGSRFCNAPANYGIIGIPDPNNDPGSCNTYTKWKDLEGNFWITPEAYIGNYPANVVWKYDLSSNLWTCMFKSKIPFGLGNYYKVCEFDTLNVPNARREQRSAVTDNQGRFWLFGGEDMGANGANDLWVFDSQKLQWNWIMSNGAASHHFGTKGVASASNMPYGRMGAVAWWGNDNRFYLFGGFGPGLQFADLWVYTPDTNCISIAATPPVSNFTADITTLCENDCVHFTNLSSNATSLQWIFPGGTPSLSTDQNPTACYQTAGIYNVTLVASNAAVNDTLTFNNYIFVTASPPTPIVKDFPGIGNDTLVCGKDTSYKSYQWYLDSTLIPGATDTFLVVTQSGNYNIKVTNASGCKTAVGINVVIGLQNYVIDHFVSLSPNPTENELRIQHPGFEIESINIYNMLGQNIQSEQRETRNSKRETILNVSSLPSGIYFVQFIGERERWTGCFVKNK